MATAIELQRPAQNADTEKRFMDYQKKNREHYPHVVIEMRFVGHGAQIDAYDHTYATPDGQGIIHRTECFDFAGSRSVCKSANMAIKIALEALNKGLK